MLAVVKLMVGYMRMNNLNQQELATVVGADPAQVSRWLTGRHTPCRAWQMRIAHVLGEVEHPKVGKLRRLRHAR